MRFWATLTAAGVVMHEAAALPTPPVFHSPNYYCKNGTAPWPVCKPVLSGAQFRLKEPLITAWWGPYGYGSSVGDPYPLRKYAEANFNVVELSDRTPAHKSFNESWPFIQQGYEYSQADGLFVIMDTYAPLYRRWNGITGGHFAGGGNAFSNTQNVVYAKLTTPELEWLAPQLLAYPSTVGILLSDDTVDLAKDEITNALWMRNATPQLLPVVNQCDDGSEWLPRAGISMLAYETYQISPTRTDIPPSDVIGQARDQLLQLDVQYDHAVRFGLQTTPLFNVGDGGGTGVVNSASLTSFQAYSALAYGATGLVYYCWFTGLWNGTTNSTLEPAYSSAQGANADVLGWGADILAYSDAVAVYHTGWAAPTSVTGTMNRAPSDGDPIITGMSDELLVGIKVAPQPNSRSDGGTWPHRGPAPSTSDELLGAVPDAVAIVVDKRVEYGQQPPAATRGVIITFALSVTAVEIVSVDPAEIARARRGRAESWAAGVENDGDVDAYAASRSSTVHVPTAEGIPITVNLQLVGGGGAFLRIHAADPVSFVASARAMRPWRYNLAAADWNAIRTTQYPFYNYFYQSFPSTPMPLGVLDIQAVADAVAAQSAAASASVSQAPGSGASGAVDVSVVGTAAERMSDLLQARLGVSSHGRRRGKGAASPRCGASQAPDSDEMTSRLASGDAAAVMTVLSSIGFNAYTAPATYNSSGGDDVFYDLLNTALNTGAVMLASPPLSGGAQAVSPAPWISASARSLRGTDGNNPAGTSSDDGVVWTAAQVDDAIASYSCHPNWAGVWLSSIPLNASAANGALPAAAAVRFAAAHMFTPVPVTDAAVSSALAQSGLPLAPLAVPGSAGLPAMLQAYSQLLSAATDPATAGSMTAWVVVDACAPGASESGASLMFRAMAALAYGARGLWWDGVARCVGAADPALFDSLALVAQQLAGPPGWGPQLLAANASGRIIFASESAQIPGSIPPGPGQLVTALGPDLLAAVLPQTPADAAPPLILLVDTSCVTSAAGCAQGPTRVATATLDASVLGWGVQESDQTAGFTSCGKTVVGREVSVLLLPGGGELLLLTQQQGPE